MFKGRRRFSADSTNLKIQRNHKSENPKSSIRKFEKILSPNIQKLQIGKFQAVKSKNSKDKENSKLENRKIQKTQIGKLQKRFNSDFVFVALLSI
jgi:hypothetical protein